MTAPVQVGPSSSYGGLTPSTPRLTPRQLQVLHLAANGCTNKEIGRRLGTTEDTVKSQMAAILRLLHVDDRTQAVAVGIKLELVSLDAVTVSPRPERAKRGVRTVVVRPPSDEMDDELADIGDRIRAERQAQGLSEVALAERAGLDRATLRRIQDGIGTLRTFLQVCAALDVDVSYILSAEWAMPKESAAPNQQALWTVSQVAAYLGYTGPVATKTARTTLHRLGVQAVGREPGKNGESLYQADQVKAAQAARPRKRATAARRAFQGPQLATPIRTS